jgi:hypothetical protein
MDFDYLSDRIANLRIRQLLLPSESEQRFLGQEWLTQTFHSPVPSSFGLRFYPVSRGLNEQLYGQIGDFEKFNRLCFILLRCCQGYYFDNRVSFSRDCDELLDEWDTAIGRGDYYCTSTYFAAFAEGCLSSMCFNSAHFKPLHAGLELLPRSLFNNWQISFLLDQSNSADCLSRLSMTHLFKNGSFDYVEIVKPKGDLLAGLEKLTIYLRSELEIGDIVIFLDDFRAIFGSDMFYAPSGRHDFGHQVRPCVSLQRGFVGLKLLLRLLGLITFYYDSEYNYAYTRHDAPAVRVLG